MSTVVISLSVNLLLLAPGIGSTPYCFMYMMHEGPLLFFYVFIIVLVSGWYPFMEVFP